MTSKNTKKITALIICVLMLSVLLMGCSRRAKSSKSVTTSGRGKRTSETTVETISSPSTDRTIKNKSPKEMTPEEIAEYLTSRVVKVSTPDRLGSGFFIDSNGTFVTNYHVIEGADQIEVYLSDGAKYEVSTLLDFSPYYDVAVAKIDMTGNDYLSISTEYKQGADVYAYGSPKNMDSSFTSGTLSAISREIGLIDCIQIDAAISKGNSGGPVVNNKGEVLGINSFSRSDAQNMNFAIKMSVLDKLGMDKNYSVNRYREWYNTETGRSYMGSADGKNFFYTYVHTFSNVTGEECIASTDDFDRFVDGYSIMYAFYCYEYTASTYDAYRDYLREIGYEYVGATREMGLDGVLFENDFEGYSIVMLIDTVDNILIISCPFVE